MLKSMEKKSLKVFLKEMRKLGFNSIIIPSSKVIINDMIHAKKNFVLKKYINYLVKRKHPFYLCNGDKCLKINNKKGWYKLPNNKIGKYKLINGEYKNQLLKMIFHEEYENKYKVIDILKTGGKNKNENFDLKIFIDNMEKDLQLEGQDLDFEIITDGNTILINFFKNVLNQEKCNKIIEYFKSYKKELKKLNININIEINLMIEID